MLSSSTIIAALLVGLVSANPIEKRASCDCGYKDSNGRIWRESVVSDFTQSAGALAAVNANWDIQSWTQPANPSNGSPLARQNLASNVFQYQDALGLRTLAYDNSGTTKIAEIDSKRHDIRYGTFRMRAQVPHVPGVCFGFFSYNGTTTPVSEQDIEFLSSDANYYQRVHYTNQPGTVGGVVNGNAYHEKLISGADFTTFGEHRFDWVPGSTSFYYNGNQVDTITKNVPSVGSLIIANVWSDGGSWTHGPPTAEAAATIQYIKMYFNSTAGISEATFNSQCQSAGNPAPCSI